VTGKWQVCHAHGKCFKLRLHHDSDLQPAHI
jgi:hypothetical protein